MVDRDAPQFKRVVMTLGQALEGDFFKEYIKIGMFCPVQMVMGAYFF